MKRIWFAAVAALAVLVGTADQSLAQGYPGGIGYMMMPAPVQSVMPASMASAMKSGGGCAAPGCTSPGCTSGGCADGCCDSPMGWTHGYYAYGGFTYLRPRDAEVVYATIANSQNAPFIERGALGMVDPDYQPGFFAGFGAVIDECSSFGVQFSMFESTTTNNITTVPNLVVSSLVMHPATINANATGLSADGALDVSYDILDFDYRSLIAYDCDYKLNYLVGLRLAQLEQNFRHNIAINGVTSVNTDVDFYGAGVRLGLEGERYVRSGLMVYGKSYLSLLPGEVRADYSQSSAFNNVPVDASWRAGRMVSILDLELGIGWRNACDTIRCNVGYVFSGWNNIVQTDEWIRGVKTNDFIDMTDKMTFDGLVARIEARW